MPSITFKPAPVTEPLYYLHNAEMVIEWSLNHHSDLLLDDELALLKQLLQLDTAPKALLFRLMMRRGELFRLDALNYKEAEPLSESLTYLYRYLMVEADPCLSITELTGLCRKAECLELALELLPEIEIKKSLSKAELFNLLVVHSDPISKPLVEWWQECPFNVIRFNCRDLFDRIRLMFFGNLYQDWSEFVVTELRYLKYESVDLSSDSRAFRSRTEVDHYLYLADVQNGLKQGESIEVLAEQVLERLDVAELSPWLSEKMHKLLFELGHQAEREKNTELALRLYELSGNSQAKLRQLRVMEKVACPGEVLEKSRALLETVKQPELHLGINRVMKRAARKSGLDLPANPSITLPKTKLTLAQQADCSVETMVSHHIDAEGVHSFHVESRLMNTLFALFFWPAIYKPVPGAFFNPFQDKPVDLYRSGFKALREDEINAAFGLLEDDSYRDLILQRFREKQFTACRLIHWPSVSEGLLELSLSLIPPADLRALFEYMFLDLRNHRRGLPDLICFDQRANTYRMIEVKGPGDRLQDHQRLWLEYLYQKGIDVEVCHVVWATPDN